MSEWKNIQLGDVLDIKHGYAFKGEYFSSEGPGPIILTPGNFAIGGGFIAAKPKYYRGMVPSEYRLRPGDLVVTMTDLSKSGDTLGYPAIIPEKEEYLHNQRIGLVEITSPNQVCKEYIYNSLKTEAYRQHILASATGSTVRHTSPSRIRSYILAIPPLRVQRAIAAVLGALDEKIAVNSRMMGVADELVRVRYEKYSQRASDSIAIDDLGLLIRETVAAGSIGETEDYIALQHMPRRNIWLSEWESSRGIASAKTRFRRGDILFGKLRPYFHKVGITFVDGVSSTDIFVIRPRENSYRGWLLAALASDDVVAHASAVGDGTRMPRASWRDLASYEVPWVGFEEAAGFSSFVSSLANRIGLACAENRSLRLLRDTLLPKLMSGEIRVREAEKIVEEVK